MVRLKIIYPNLLTYFLAQKLRIDYFTHITTENRISFALSGLSTAECLGNKLSLKVIMIKAMYLGLMCIPPNLCHNLLPYNNYNNGLDPLILAGKVAL